MAKKVLIFRHFRHKQSGRHTKVKMSLNQRQQKARDVNDHVFSKEAHLLISPYSHPLYLLPLCLSGFSFCCPGLYFLLSPYVSIFYFYFFTLTGNKWNTPLFLSLPPIFAYAIARLNIFGHVSEASRSTFHNCKIIQANRIQESYMQSPSLAGVGM